MVVPVFSVSMRIHALGCSLFFQEPRSTDLRLSIASHDHTQVENIQEAEPDLSKHNIRATLRELVQPAVNVHMHGRIDQRPCVAIYFAIITFASKVDFDLLHICFPVDLCIWITVLAW